MEEVAGKTAAAKAKDDSREAPGEDEEWMCGTCGI